MTGNDPFHVDDSDFDDVNEFARAEWVVANKSQHPSIDRVIDEHGLETLQDCITEARAYDRGETTTRQFAADTGLSYELGVQVLAAIGELLGFDSDGER